MVPYKCMLVKGDDEEVVDVVERIDGALSPDGRIMPAITIKHASGEYLLSRHFMINVFIYKPLEKINIEDINKL